MSPRVARGGVSDTPLNVPLASRAPQANRRPLRPDPVTPACQSQARCEQVSRHVKVKRSVFLDEFFSRSRFRKKAKSNFAGEGFARGDRVAPDRTPRCAFLLFTKKDTSRTRSKRRANPQAFKRALQPHKPRPRTRDRVRSGKRSAIGFESSEYVGQDDRNARKAARANRGGPGVNVRDDPFCVTRY